MILYLDNIRGFNEQSIELNEVNFLVGENSTGKSSVISIISLLSDFNFGLSGDFKSLFVDFGPFSETVNKGRNSDTFSIGLKKQRTNLSSIDYDEVFISYKDEEGFPAVNILSVRLNDKILTSRILKNSISYKLKQIEIKDSSKEWVLDHETDRNVFLTGEFVPNDEDFVTIDQLRRSPNYIPFVIGTRNRKTKSLEEFQDKGATSETWIDRTIWIDPLRSKPQRIYEPKKMSFSAEGEHIPTILRDIFLTKDQKDSKVIIEGLEKFGKASGLFDQIKIDQYRKSKDSPFALIFKLKNKNLKISNVGYGISQIMPILTEILRQKNKYIFLVQQPEVHLHPRSQAFFGEFLFEQFANQKKRFIIETHSDFIIDRFRLKMQQSELKGLNKRVNILFFETNGKNNCVTRMKIDEKGNYSDDQPKKFREFFLKEEMDLLGF